MVKGMDIHLHCREAGPGRPLILLHGNGEDGSYFIHQIRYFSKYYRVIAVDSRGHGGSPRGQMPLTLSRMAEDLKEFMDERQIGSGDILGFSDGANIAMLFALKYPERIGKLILNGGNLSPAGVKPSVQIPTEIGFWIASHAARRSYEAGRKAEILGLMVKEPKIPPERLKGLTMKTLVIAGTKDMIKTAHTRQIFESLPDAKLRFIPGSHFVAKENPVAFNKAVAAFLMDDRHPF